MTLTPAGFSRPVSGWRLALVALTVIFVTLSIRWSGLDNSPPAWDQGLYLYQATKLHFVLLEGGVREFLTAVFNLDRGRVPLILMLVQPAFYVFGPVLDAAVITLNLCWFLLAWALFGIARELAGSSQAGKASFFTLTLFGLYPLTVMLTHNFLVELLLTSLVCASLYSILMLEKKRSIGWSIVSGFFIGLGLLTKVTFVVFVFPVLLLTAFVVCRSTSFKYSVRIVVPGVLAALVIALPYYVYNFREILNLTVFLSSKGLAELYGFGEVLDVSTILNYWMSMFYSPVFAIVLLVLAFAVAQLFRHGRLRFSVVRGYHLVVLGLWFVLPLFLATFGQIKDPRYLFPALLPLFIVAGIALARPGSRRLAWCGFALISILALPGFLYSNGLLNKHSLTRISQLPGLRMVELADVPPDPRDWQAERLVTAMVGALAGSFDNGKLIFLGGNRYYHLRLLDYQGLRQGARFDYVTLPYYANPGMTVEDAIAFIKGAEAAGVLFKTGANWPEFSSRLDKRIVDVLGRDPGYEEQQLNVVQPDGSRFVLFKNKASYPTQIDAPARLVGNWKVGEGIARIDVAQDGSISVRTEAGTKGTAILRDGRVHIEEWGVSGGLTADYGSIRWSNGSVWRRASGT